MVSRACNSRLWSGLHNEDILSDECALHVLGPPKCLLQDGAHLGQLLPNGRSLVCIGAQTLCAVVEEAQSKYAGLAAACLLLAQRLAEVCKGQGGYTACNAKSSITDSRIKA